MSKFKVGDKVRILPTATERKYEDGIVGWDYQMQDCVGQIGTIEKFHTGDRLKNTAIVSTDFQRETWTWYFEDLILESEYDNLVVVTEEKSLDVTLAIRVECDQAIEKLQELINLVNKLKEKL